MLVDLLVRTAQIIHSCLSRYKNNTRVPTHTISTYELPFLDSLLLHDSMISQFPTVNELQISDLRKSKLDTLEVTTTIEQ